MGFWDIIGGIGDNLLEAAPRYILPAATYLGGSYLSSNAQANQGKEAAQNWQQWASMLKPTPEEKKLMRERTLNRINEDFLSAGRSARNRLASRGLGGGQLGLLETNLTRGEEAAKAGAERDIELWGAGVAPPSPQPTTPSTGQLMMGSAGDIAQTLAGLSLADKVLPKSALEKLIEQILAGDGVGATGLSGLGSLAGVAGGMAPVSPEILAALGDTAGLYSGLGDLGIGGSSLLGGGSLLGGTSLPASSIVGGSLLGGGAPASSIVGGSLLNTGAEGAGSLAASGTGASAGLLSGVSGFALPVAAFLTATGILPDMLGNIFGKDVPGWQELANQLSGWEQGKTDFTYALHPKSPANIAARAYIMDLVKQGIPFDQAKNSVIQTMLSTHSTTQGPWWQSPYKDDALAMYQNSMSDDYVIGG
jgi:hypothetical protein